GRPPGQVRFSVHRQPAYPSFWQPIAMPDQPRTEIQIYLEANNTAASACWITAAEIAGAPAMETVIGVREAGTGKFAPANPLPPRQITTVSVHFLVGGQPPASDEPFRATLIMTDHLGERYPVKVVLH